MQITIGLIGMSIFVTLLSGFGESAVIVTKTLITASSFGVLDEIRSGELWRLITPAFIHFDIYHLVFNLLWVWVCGGAIEKRRGWLVYLFIFAVSASVSNLAQYWYSGPAFGGMSGVVYAFVGYIWMQMKFNPIGYAGVIPRAVIPLMMIWFIACWLNLIPNVANIAHTTGLILGVIWGRVDALIAFNRYRAL